MKNWPRVSHVSSAPPPRNTSWLSAALLLGPLTLLGRLLFAGTHHRPLGAVTLAALTLVAWVGVELLVRRGLGEDASLESLSIEVGGGDRKLPPRQIARFVIGSLGITFSLVIAVHTLTMR